MDAGESDGLSQAMRRAVKEGDTVVVCDENGVVVVQIETEWGKARQVVNVPDGWSARHEKSEQPQGGEGKL